MEIHFHPDNPMGFGFQPGAFDEPSLVFGTKRSRLAATDWMCTFFLDRCGVLCKITSKRCTFFGGLSKIDHEHGHF